MIRFAILKRLPCYTLPTVVYQTPEEANRWSVCLRSSRAVLQAPSVSAEQRTTIHHRDTESTEVNMVTNSGI